MDVIYMDEDFAFFMDRMPVSGELIAHCTVSQWRLSTWKKILAVWGAFVVQANQPVYAPVTDAKEEKFLRMLCFQPCDRHMLGSDGMTYELYKFILH